MSYKHIWYICSSSAHVYIKGVNCFIGQYFRKTLDGYSLTDLSDLANGTNAYIREIIGVFCEGLTREVFVLFNYNHFGPIALLLSPGRTPELFTGYEVWDFSHYHYRYFLGYGIHHIHPKLDTPLMFYPCIRGSFEVGEVISVCMLEFANQFDVTRSLSRKIMKLVRRFERGFVYTLGGRKPFTMDDLFSEILWLVRENSGRRGYEHLIQIFLDHRIYYQPVIICEEFRRPLDLIRQFLYSLDDKLETLNIEKYLPKLGFRKYPLHIQNGGTQVYYLS